ncbi:MAG: class I SAM-dependent methyltransferase [Pararhodobacter sp.]|nr:class I SAM-dependent methyltransferase [Pararhodobacter sp.]
MTAGHRAPLLHSLRIRLPRLRWALRKLFLRNPPKGNVYYGDIAEYYDAERETKLRWQREQAAVSALLERLPQGLRVLDVPVGTGRFMEFYIQRGDRVCGLDASTSMLERARARAGNEAQGIELVEGDATALNFADGSFDLVVSVRFLRHILPFAQAKQALTEMARVCRGHAIIEIGYATGASHWPSENKPIRDQLNRDDIVALFRQHGFEVEDEVQTLTRRTRKRSVFLLRRASGDAG